MARDCSRTARGLSRRSSVLKNTSLHATWLVTILLAIIAWLLIKSPNGEDLRDYLAFASSIAALILAVIAIFQTIVAQNNASTVSAGLQRSLGEVEKAAQNIATTSSQLSNQQKDFVGHVERVPVEIQSLEKRIAEGFNSKKQNTNSATRDGDIIELLFFNTPFANQIVWIVIAEAIRTNKSINTENLFPSHAYLIGWMNGALTIIAKCNPLGLEINSLQSDSGGIIFDIVEKGNAAVDSLWEEFASYPLEGSDDVIVDMVFNYFGTEWPSKFERLEVQMQDEPSSDTAEPDGNRNTGDQ